MKTTHDIKWVIAGALLSGGFAVTGLVLGAGPAQAHPGGLGGLSDGGLGTRAHEIRCRKAFIRIPAAARRWSM